MRPSLLVPWLLVLGSLGVLAAEPVAVPRGILALDRVPAPALRVVDMDGARFGLDQARGRWVFVHFWASWCGPCRKEMPSIERMAGKLEGTLEVVLINTAEDEDTVFAFLAEVAPELHSYMDRDGLVTEDWRPRGLPATYLVDPEGRVRYQALGGRPWDESIYLEFLRGLTAQ